MKDGLYHRELGKLPGAVCPFLGVEFSLIYSKHAQREVLSDKYGPPRRMPFKLWFDISHVVEIEIVGGNLSKIIVRFENGNHRFEHPNETLDLVLALAVESKQCRELFVKTLWFNERTDAHVTLDKTKYVNP